VGVEKLGNKHGLTPSLNKEKSKPSYHYNIYLILYPNPTDYKFNLLLLQGKKKLNIKKWSDILIIWNFVVFYLCEKPNSNVSTGCNWLLFLSFFIKIDDFKILTG